MANKKIKFIELQNAEGELIMLIRIVNMSTDFLEKRWDKFINSDYDYEEQFVEQLKDEKHTIDRIFTEVIQAD